MRFTTRTHFLDLAIAAVLSLLSPVLDGQVVADQLYSFILTAIFGLGTDRPPWEGLEFTVAIGRTKRR